MKTNPNVVKMMSDLIKPERKKMSIEEKRSHSEKVNMKVKAQAQPMKPKKKTSSSIGSNHSKQNTVIVQQSGVRITKPTFNVQINSNQNKIIDPVQFANALSVAAQLSLKITQTA